MSESGRYSNADWRYLGKSMNTDSSEAGCRRLIEEKLRSLLEALNTDQCSKLKEIGGRQSPKRGFGGPPPEKFQI